MIFKNVLLRPHRRSLPGVGPFNGKTLNFFFDCACIIADLEDFINKSVDLFWKIFCWNFGDDRGGNHCRIGFIEVDSDVWSAMAL